jgi:hypothetical protein
MAIITTRSAKGTPLTISEMDQNFLNLENSKIKRDHRTIETAASIIPAGTIYAVTALSQSLTIGAPSITQDGWRILLIITDNGTARTLTWNAIYRPFGIPLVTETIPNDPLYALLIYNAQDIKWDVVAQSY